MLRVILFLGTNLAILLILGVVIQITGVDQIIEQQTGAPWMGSLIIAAVFGMGGSFISLLLSKTMAKRAMRVQIIENPRSEAEQWLVGTVKRQAERAGIGMPEVGVFDSPVMNAFATGASKNNALVAVSTGLLQNMSRDEVEAVLGHEVSHVANGDMVTLTLIQGVLNTFVIFAARIIAQIMTRDRRGGFAYFGMVMLLQMVFGILASIIVAWFSRYREFRADAGGSSLAGRQKMISALQALQKTYGQSEMPKEVAAFGISGTLGSLMASHPPLEKRIEALRQGLS